MQDLHKLYEEFENSPKPIKELRRAIGKFSKAVSKKPSTDWNKFREIHVTRHHRAFEDLRLLEVYRKAQLLDQGGPERSNPDRAYDDDYRDSVKNPSKYYPIQNRVNLYLLNKGGDWNQQRNNLKADLLNPARRSAIFQEMDELEQIQRAKKESLEEAQRAEKESKAASAQNQKPVPEPSTPSASIYSSLLLQLEQKENPSSAPVALPALESAHMEVKVAKQELLEAYMRFCNYVRGRPQEQKSDAEFAAQQRKTLQVLSKMAAEEEGQTEVEKINSLTALYKDAVEVATTQKHQRNFEPLTALATHFKQAEKAHAQDLADVNSSIAGLGLGNLSGQLGALSVLFYTN